MQQAMIVRPQDLLGSLAEPALAEAPPELYLRGDRSLLEYGPRVSVVGSRDASRAALEWARQITEDLVGQGVTVVSGLALGIDTVAHRTALACGGRTVAVLGTALDHYAVRHNRGLQDEIGERGLLVSQFRSGASPHRTNFPRRNRTMALLSDATIIVEAGETSGTRHQGWEAIRLARPVLFPKAFLERTKAAWPDEMMKYGAFGFDEESLLRVLEDLPHRQLPMALDDDALPF